MPTQRSLLFAILVGAISGYAAIRVAACSVLQLGSLCGAIAVIVGAPIGGVLAVGLLLREPRGSKARRIGLAGELLRCITPATCALAAGYAIVLPMLAALTYEFKYGRPSSTSGLAIPFGVAAGIVFASAAAALGYWVQGRVMRSRWAGRMDLRLAAALILVIVAVPTVFAVRAAKRAEARHAPRVIVSTGALVRTEGQSALAPATSDSFIWVRHPHPDHPTRPLRWNNHPLQLAIGADQGLSVAAGDVRIQLPLEAFDYAREVYAATATLRGGDEEWLALLIYLRATGRRNLLLVFDPAGTLVHQELIAVGPRARGRLTVNGARSARQEIVASAGAPLRLAAVR